MPFFKARLLYQQFGSVPGKGQIKGVKYIQKIINKDFKDKRVDCVKCDIKKAFPSTRIKVVKDIIGKYCHKNPPLLYLVDRITSNYPNGCLIIGGYFSTWAFNLVMSFVLRKLLEYGKERRGVFERFVVNVVCYADDFIIFGYKSNLIKALKKLKKDIQKMYGYTLKDEWEFCYFVEKAIQDTPRHKNKFIDMMGFRIYRNRVTIRKRIFKRIRRQLIRAKRDKLIPHWRARKLAAYNSWIKYSLSNKIVFNYYIDYLLDQAANAISFNQREELNWYERDLQHYPSGSFDFYRWKKNRRHFKEEYYSRRAIGLI